MNVIEPLGPEDKSGEKIREKINEILSFLFPPEMRRPEKEKVSHFPLNQAPRQEGWRPVGKGDKYWMPPTGWRNAAGTAIAGMVPIDEVPEEVRGTVEPPISNDLS